MTPAERIEALRSGEDQKLIMRLRSGFLTLSPNQFLPGYCLLLADPIVGQLNNLEWDQRRIFLEDLALVSEAVQAVTRAKRTNLAIYGNVDPFLHAHVWPRFEDEPTSRATLPPLMFPESFRLDREHEFSMEKHGELMGQLRDYLATKA